MPELQPWAPGFSESHRITIGYGRKLLLSSSATVHSIEILNGGKLVIADTNQPIVLRARHILIGNNGELHIGSPDCPYKGNLTISLYGRSDDTSDEHSYFGRKYVGVGTGGTLEIHAEKKLSWTFLNKTLHPGEGNENSYHFERSWGNRGIIVHVIEPTTGEVLRNDRFDTYRSKDESRRLAQYVEAVEDGQILAMMVNDEGSNNLEDSARKTLAKLGSSHFHRLGFRHPWSFITVKGDTSSVVENHAVYQGTKASSEARSSHSFTSGYGEHFVITTVSQWVQEAEWTEWFDRDDERGSGDWEKLSDLHKAFPERLCSNPLDIEAETVDGVPANMTGEMCSPNLTKTMALCVLIKTSREESVGTTASASSVANSASIAIDTLSNCSLLVLEDAALGWKPGDRLVVSSTDYSMYQAEEFSVLPCATCTENQVKVEGTKASSEARSSHSFTSGYGEHFVITTVSQWVQEAEWTEWFDRDDERGSGDWEKLSDLHKAFPERLCSNPLDIEAETVDGVPANMTGDVFSKFDKNYGLVCLNKDQQGGICRNYRIRFLCGKLVRPQASIAIDTLSNCSLLVLEDAALGWKPGDRLVVSSTDYSMYQAEEFSVLPCATCTENQVKVEGKPLFLHMGELVDGVDMRAEVGLLSRNVLIRGEMETSCYGSESCKFFSFDTFGGHLKVEHGFKAVHIQGVEFMHMGQQSMGHYPVHFHMNGDVDERGGYDPPTYVKDLSIHHSFSRCVTIHGSNGLLVKDVVGYDTLGHCFFTEDGPEERNTFDHCLGLLVKASTLLPSDRDSRMCRDITEGAYPGYVAKPRQDCSATSTFWIANPNNNLINCAAAGSEAGMILDNGVKTTEANAKDKRPYLSLIGARYSPHQEADPFKPRAPALIHHFVAYKNQDTGAWLRGGDIWLDDCQFADNGIGLTLASGGTFPDDDGSRQEVKNSLFVGESENRGMPFPDGRIWGPSGLDHSGRTLPRGVDFPIRGMQIYDGPINVQNCTFRKYVALDGRHTSAFGFRLNNSWQSCPNNNVTGITFDDVPITSRVFFGEPGPWFNKMHMDGDKTTIFHDVDGSVSEYPGAFLVKEDNWLLRHPDCIDVPDWRAAICSGRYAQIYIQARNPANLNMKMVKDEYPDKPLELVGALGKRHHYQQFQPVVTLAKGYTVHWDAAAPTEVTVWIINFNRNDWINIGFCYPKGTTFSIISDLHNRLTKETRKTGTFMKTAQREKIGHTHQARGYYYWEEETGLLFLKVQAHNNRDAFAFCSVKGCERVKIKAIIPKGSGPSDCMAEAYPRYAEMPVVDVPMPKKLPRSSLSQTSEHFLEVKVESYTTRFFHIKEDFAYAEANGKKIYQSEDGIQLTVLDGHSGKVMETKDKLAFVGFKGSFRPDWVRMAVDKEHAKLHQVLPVPIVRVMKL
ncbi:Cell migration-inducing and hyaluronan-binding protein [Bagarius yarrelli]|uniref:hyaluronoglucosaminidase n=1 Tax=Bagarius yarrelli TaxID=175774 RepID=A0A556TSH8_BAGYA|nr:Cell migration-inducing and hyaluronan-binding protein [Bagarius yarrelli]